MNPLVLIGIGAVVLMAMGGKKKSEPAAEYGDDGDDGEYGDDGDGGSGTPTMLARKTDLKLEKKTVFSARLEPLRWRDSIMKGNGGDAATACWNAGHKEEMDLTMCIAKKLFPTWDWNDHSGWQADAWPMIRNVARVKLGLQPLIA